MEKTAILHADILDIIFEGRNKEYGAYELRRTYNKRMRISIAVMLCVILLLCIGHLIAGRQKPGENRIVQISQDVLLEQIEPEQPPPPVIPPPQPPPQQIQSVQYTAPIIVDEDVPEEEKPPVVDDLEAVKIDVKTQDGEKDLGIIAPPADDNGRDIVVAPKAIEEDKDKIWTSVQIESSYPGGRPAWERFLKRNLHYPQQAQDNEIQGTVIVQFVVDKEGNVSNVIALSGPEDLKAEAVRVIKKSGKWTPAIQNGNQVPSYKKQPIGFTLVIE